jgi:dolichol-phosphate mannosyltransferase
MIYIVLPAYNEEAGLEALVSGLKATLETMPAGYQLLIVNDGSTDRTLEIAQHLSATLPLQVIDHGRNKGLGEALKSGLAKAGHLAQPEDIIITMDADNTHPPDLIPTLMANIENGYDVAIASRYVKGAEEVGLSFRRKLLSRAASSLLKTFFPIPGVKDYTCGYRAYKATIVKKALSVYGDTFVQERGFTSIVEILLRLRKLGMHCCEVPLVLRYDYKSGASKMPVLRTISRYGTLITHNLLSPGTRPFRNVSLG